RFPMLLSLTTTGYGKRSPTADYRRTRRGAKGVRTIKTGGRNGSVVAVLPTTDASEALVTTEHGITIRMAVKGIRSQARNTLGVRVIRLDEGDTVRDAVILEPPIEGVGPEGAGGKPSPTEPEPNEPPAEEEDSEEEGTEDDEESDEGSEKDEGSDDDDTEDDDASSGQAG
ncbi:MAG TPA: DNA gyrase C-terminal beta-propeller domain-containing protein, partial [Thermoplasmata archaeon]|nr:DNA gyrase C-terminal beta-propeller domain-containing protein [Thermoplasmata archaeon]